MNYNKFQELQSKVKYCFEMIFSAGPCDMCGKYDTLIEFSYPPDHCPIYLCHKCAAEQVE